MPPACCWSGSGRVTRLLRFLTALPKSYVGEVVLGATTNTLDDSGDVLERFDMSAVTLGRCQAAATAFVGDIEQIPPMVSAVKVGGRRLHEMARKGEEVVREPRPVTVHRFTTSGRPTDPVVFAIEVDCSSGTYIRTLAADLGVALGGGAHLRNLRRTAIGSFGLDEATPLGRRSRPTRVIAPATACVTTRPRWSTPTTWPRRATAARSPPASAGRGACSTATSELIAVYEYDRPAVVLRPANET